MVDRVLSYTGLKAMPSGLGDLAIHVSDEFLKQKNNIKNNVKQAYKEVKDLGGELYDDAGTQIKNTLGNNIEFDSKAGKVLSDLEKQLNTGTGIGGGKIIRDVAQFEEGRKFLLTGLNSTKNIIGEVVDSVLYGDMKRIIKSYDAMIEDDAVEKLIKTVGDAEKKSLAKKNIVAYIHAKKDYAKTFKADSVDKYARILKEECSITALNFLFDEDIEKTIRKDILSTLL